MKIIKPIFSGASKAVKRLKTTPTEHMTAKELRDQRKRDYNKRIEDARRR